MAKGKQSLLELTDPKDIIHTDEEVGSIPFFMIDDEYGISGGYGDYALVIKKQASKNGKEENGEDPKKVYSYYRWDEMKYCGTTESIIQTYADVKERFLNKKLIKSKDLQDLINIRLEIKAAIHKALDVKVMDNQVVEICNLMDTVQYLKEQVKQTANELDEFKQLKEKSIAEIKEATTIIVNRDKPKKHRTPKEKE